MIINQKISNCESDATAEALRTPTAPPAPASSADRYVTVFLSSVPTRLREAVADEMVTRLKLAGVEGLMWKLRALGTDAKLVVPEWKAELVLKGKRPPGETPKDLFL